MQKYKIQDEIIQMFIDIFRNEDNKKQFEKLTDTSKYKKAKYQEEFLIKKSNNILYKLDPYWYDSALDLIFGDFKDRTFGNYYDLKVGDNEYNLAGSITYKSIKYYGNSLSNNHWYICTTLKLNKLYIINAKELYQKILNQNPTIFQLSDEELEKYYVGEIDYRKEYSSYI